MKMGRVLTRKGCMYVHTNYVSVLHYYDFIEIPQNEHRFLDATLRAEDTYSYTYLCIHDTRRQTAMDILWCDVNWGIKAQLIRLRDTPVLFESEVPFTGRVFVRWIMSNKIVGISYQADVMPYVRRTRLYLYHSYTKPICQRIFNLHTEEWQRDSDERRKRGYEWK